MRTNTSLIVKCIASFSAIRLLNFTDTFQIPANIVGVRDLVYPVATSNDSSDAIAIRRGNWVWPKHFSNNFHGG